MGLCDTSTLNCYKVYDKEDLDEFRQSFCVLPSETFLFIRDSSTFNTKDKGLVVTDLGIHFVEDNSSSENIIFIFWQEIKRVKRCEQNKAYFEFELANQPKRKILIDYFIRKYIDFSKNEPAKLGNSIKFILEVLNRASETVETVPTVDINIVIANSKYSCQMVGGQDELIQKYIDRSNDSIESYGELKDYMMRLRSYEESCIRIERESKINIENISNTADSFRGALQSILQSRQASRGVYKPDTKNQIIDLVINAVQLGSYAVEKKQIKKLERKAALYTSFTNDIVMRSKKNMEYYLGYQLLLQNNSLVEIKKLYENIQCRISTENSPATIVLFQKCFMLYCLSLRCQQISRGKILTFLSDNSVTPYSLKEIIQSEISTLDKDSLKILAI